MKFRIEKEIKAYLFKQAEKIIHEQLKRYAAEMKVKYGRVRFSDTQSKWGTCFPDNSLQFNWRLIMAPIFVINYVVVHELSHITEKNHSHKFWSIVRRYNPSYRQQIKWLKLNGELLKL
jgi:predicted metal-dependent hydrolase